MKEAFIHKSAIGVWINDVRDTAFQTNNWPPMRIDECTEKSLYRCVDLLSQWGYNQFCLWGLLNSYSWSLDFAREMNEARLQIVRRFIAYAHEKGVRIIYGLGIYSWGYDQILRRHPSVRGTSAQAMCGSKEESFEWVAKIIDFIFDTLDVDGLHFESADQGRCRCPECARSDDFSYHCGLNARAAEYVKRRWPGKIVMINMISWQSWDKRITKNNKTEMEMLRTLGGYADYIVDPGHLGHYIEKSLLPSLIASLPCAFGNAGGFWTYCWPAWNRLRAFLPYTRTAHEALRALYQAGGRAVEYYTGPVYNPGVEINTAFAGYMLNNAGAAYEDALLEVAAGLYGPKTDSAARRLAGVIEKSETVWFSNWTGKLPLSWKPTQADSAVTFMDFDAYRQSPASRPVQIFLDGAKNLTEYIEPENWIVYRDDLRLLRSDAADLLDAVAEKDKLARMVECFDRCMEDLEELIDFEKWK
jgi:hypothetical protein